MPVPELDRSEFAVAIQKFPLLSQILARKWVRDAFDIVASRALSPSIHDYEKLHELRNSLRMPTATLFKALVQFAPPEGYISAEDSVICAYNEYPQVLELYLNRDPKPVKDLLESIRGAYRPYHDLFEQLGEEYFPGNGLGYSLARGIVPGLPPINLWSALSRLASLKPESISFASDDEGVEHLNLEFRVRYHRETQSGEPVAKLRTEMLSFPNPITVPLNEPITLSGIRNGLTHSPLEVISPQMTPYLP